MQNAPISLHCIYMKILSPNKNMFFSKTINGVSATVNLPALDTQGMNPYQLKHHFLQL